MMQRLDYVELSKASIRKLFELSAESTKGSIEPRLADLVRIRASQVNGCAFCVDMHVKEATRRGERALRLHHIAVFRDSPLFTEREKAGLLWTEAVTRLAEAEVTDELYERARSAFSAQELSDLTVIIGTINFWNRLSVSFRVVPGSRDQQLGLQDVELS